MVSPDWRERRLLTRRSGSICILSSFVAGGRGGRCSWARAWEASSAMPEWEVSWVVFSTAIGGWLAVVGDLCVTGLAGFAFLGVAGAFPLLGVMPAFF